MTSYDFFVFFGVWGLYWLRPGRAVYKMLYKVSRIEFVYTDSKYQRTFVNYLGGSSNFFIPEPSVLVSALVTFDIAC